MIDIRQPSFTATTETEQLLQMRSYLYQLAQQLQWAFSTISVGGEQQYHVNTVESKSTNADDASGGIKNFSVIKNLIIKSADIVEAFRTEITKTLTGMYVAESDFGTFEEQTIAKFTETDKNINQNYINIQKIQTNVEGLENVIRQTNAYIRTGFLYEEDDGTARYGVEIGEQAQKNGAIEFKKFSRMTSDRLSFFDSNDAEVAYISDRKLYITYASCHEMTTKKATVKNALVVGDYILEYCSDGHLTLS